MWIFVPLPYNIWAIIYSEITFSYIWLTVFLLKGNAHLLHSLQLISRDPFLPASLNILATAIWGIAKGASEHNVSLCGDLPPTLTLTLKWLGNRITSVIFFWFHHGTFRTVFFFLTPQTPIDCKNSCKIRLKFFSLPPSFRQGIPIHSPKNLLLCFL